MPSLHMIVIKFGLIGRVSIESKTNLNERKNSFWCVHHMNQHVRKGAAILRCVLLSLSLYRPSLVLLESSQ
jgi:hypothetical protein